MARTESITVDGRTYEVGWNDEGWFAVRADGVSTRAYCRTLDELRQAVADGDWELSELEDMETPCYCNQLAGGRCDFCSGLAALDGQRAKDQLEWQRAAAGDLAALYSEIGGEG
jgi:hypothetical protein